MQKKYQEGRPLMYLICHFSQIATPPGLLREALWQATVSHGHLFHWEKPAVLFFVLLLWKWLPVLKKLPATVGATLVALETVYQETSIQVTRALQVSVKAVCGNITLSKHLTNYHWPVTFELSDLSGSGNRPPALQPRSSSLLGPRQCLQHPVGVGPQPGLQEERRQGRGQG